MSVLDEPRLNIVELGRLLEAVEPAALLVAPRLLRRIIKHDCKLTHLGLQVPHRKSYVIGREALLALVTREELGVEHDRPSPAILLLLRRPEPDALAAAQRGQTLVKYWRLLFHCRVHQTLAIQFEEGRITEAAIRQRIHRIGQTEFDEVRTVLRQEKYLLAPHDDLKVYEEFAALYLELSFFAAPLLPRYFPAIEDFGRISQIMAEDVDASFLFAATRLPGAPDPDYPVNEADQGDEPGPPGTTTLIWCGSDKQYQDLAIRADKAAQSGNVVRAAIRRARAALVAPPLLVLETRERALAEIGQLVERLQKALHLGDAEAEAWRRALPALLSQATLGIWPAEARLLYDLQKICVDHVRPIYSPDLVEWAYSGFRQPLLRPLPNQPLVLAVKHLRVAVNRLPSVRITEPDRHTLSGLLHDALHHAEGRLRECFRPSIHDALGRVGLRPENFPERLGQAKLIEELLDRITERGFLNMSDLRDALARNQLKLPDLSGPLEFLQGDSLIRVNRELAVGAAGVYHRGEIYLRWLQRASALAFGTRSGRWFILFFALPFLGAFATLVFAQEMAYIFHLFFKTTAQPEGLHHLKLAPLVMPIGVLGIFYWFLLHWSAFRRVVARGLQAGWGAIRAVLIDLPAAFLSLPAVRWFLHSRPYLLLVNFVLKPVPVALLAWAILRGFDIAPGTAAGSAGIAFLLVGLLLNSRLGRDLEEAFIDRTVHHWEYVRGLLPGLFRLMMNVFKTILETLDRFLYAVDEWLRFRGGQGRLILVLKTVLRFVWFLVTYVVRLCANVFIEPSVNPIKHFPVVTVAAKLLVPFWGIPFQFEGLGFAIAMMILLTVPGAAGFLVWEFKENWRLYRANRPRTLRPEVIGHHGETMPRLMKPGFHSGTLPNVYAKLRRAERRAYRGGSWKAARRLSETLHHVEESIRHFTERELLAFLSASKDWTAGLIELVAVQAGSNRIRLELACTSKETLELAFEEQAGWLLAHIVQPGWLPRLTADQLTVWTTALLGFYQKAGVDLIREQIEAVFPPLCPPYDIGDEGLIVWPGHGYDTEVVYDLREEPVLHPHLKEGRPADKLPSLAAAKLLFKNQPITWEAWVAAWEPLF